MDGEHKKMKRTSFPEAGNTASPSWRPNETAAAAFNGSGRGGALAYGYIFRLGFLYWNPTFKSVRPSAYGPRSTTARVESLKEPYEGEDEEDNRQEFYPFVAEHSGEFVVSIFVSLELNKQTGAVLTA
jgi:hypothetical protein